MTAHRYRRFLFAAVMSASACAATPMVAAEHPSIASINMCTDQILLAVADAPQILGLSPYARDAERSWSAAEAARFPLLSGQAEDVLVLRPDIVLAGLFTKRATRELLKQKGLHVAEFDVANSVQDVKDQVTKVGALAGHPERAAQIVARLDSAIAGARAAASRAPFRVLAVSRRGWIAGSDTLTTSLLTTVGLINAAGEIGSAEGGYAPLETIVQLRPDFILVSDVEPYAEDQGRAFLLHPALEELYPLARRLVIPERMTVCGGPMLADAIDRLTAEIERVSRAQ